VARILAIKEVTICLKFFPKFVDVIAASWKHVLLVSTQDGEEPMKHLIPGRDAVLEAF
jgi:hypothetical protein